MKIKETQEKYAELISYARSIEPSIKPRGYCTHHIVPRSCGGTNDKQNLLVCSFEIHFEAHRLLKDMYVKHSNVWLSMWYAFFMMSKTKLGRKIVDPSEYAALQEFKNQCVWNKLAVEQYTKNGVLIEVHDSINAASCKTGINRAHIGECCRGTQRQAGGFVWKYVGNHIAYKGIEDLAEARKVSDRKNAENRRGQKRGTYVKRDIESMLKTSALRNANDTTLGKLRCMGKRFAKMIGFHFYTSKIRIPSNARVFVSKKTYTRKSTL